MELPATWTKNTMMKPATMSSVGVPALPNTLDKSARITIRGTTKTGGRVTVPRSVRRAAGPVGLVLLWFLTSATGVLPGPSHLEHLRPGHGTYQVSLPPASATLLTVDGTAQG